MKLEPRGKYAGVKIHLDEAEVQEILDTANMPEHAVKAELMWLGETFLRKLSKKIRALLEESPDLLKPRTDEQIQRELVHEAESAQAKIAAFKAGKDWKAVKVEVTFKEPA